MDLNKTTQIIIGAFTFLPFLLLAGSFVYVVYQILTLLFSEDPMMPLLMLSYVTSIIPYLFYFFLIYFVLGIFYIIHTIWNSQLDNEKKILWIVVLVTVNGVAMPVYWYLYIWNQESRQTAQLDIDQSYASRT